MSIIVCIHFACSLLQSNGHMRSYGVKWCQVGSTYAEAAAVAPTIAGIIFISFDFLKNFRENFEDKTVASVKSPTDLYFTPDDKYAFVTSKFGTLWRVAVEDMDNNKGQAEKVFEIPHPMCLNGARGLGGVAVHPDYPAKPYIYVFHNHDKVSLLENEFWSSEFCG